MSLNLATMLRKSAKVAEDGADVTGDELVAHCRERLAAYKYPREVRLMAELPKGPTGKILKKERRRRRPGGLGVEP